MAAERTGQHNLILENRERLNLSGVIEVTTFDEQTVVVQTQLGLLKIGGYALHISRFAQESGELDIDGEICQFSYSDLPREQDGKGFFSRLFR